MKIISIFILLISLAFSSGAQNYSQVDKIVKRYPASFNNIDELANRINKDFNLDEEKVRALYNWLALNIEYNYKKDLHFDISDIRIIYSDQIDKKRQLKRKKLKHLEKVLRLKKAVCIDYSELFKEVCHRIGIVSDVVAGYSKVTIYDIDRKEKVKNHAWNVVKINGDWKIIDVTWATVFISDYFQKKSIKHYNYYFFTNPKEFILTHLPSNPKWQLIDTKISKLAFFKSPLFYTNYFLDEFKISNSQEGIIQVNKRRLEIYFDSIPENKSFFYKIQGEDYTKRMYFKKMGNGKYLSSIKYKQKRSSSLTIYSNTFPSLGFKIKPSSKK